MGLSEPTIKPTIKPTKNLPTIKEYRVGPTAAYVNGREQNRLSVNSFSRRLAPPSTSRASAALRIAWSGVNWTSWRATVSISVAGRWTDGRATWTVHPDRCRGILRQSNNYLVDFGAIPWMDPIIFITSDMNSIRISLDSSFFDRVGHGVHATFFRSQSAAEANRRHLQGW